MGLPRGVLSLCGVLMSAVLVTGEDALSAKDFYEKVTKGDEVWGIVFGIEPCDKLASLKLLKEKASWLSVAWMNIADSDSRFIADVHGITSYPTLKIFNGKVEKLEIPSAMTSDAATTRPVISPKKEQLVIKEVIEKWLPSRLPAIDGRLQSVLPVDEEDTICKVTVSESDVLKIATARAVAIKFWNKLTMSVSYSDSESITCTRGSEDVEISVGDFTFETIVQSISEANINNGIDEKAALAARREIALKESESIHPIMQLKHSAVFDEIKSSQGFEVLFVLNSDSKDFASEMSSANDIQNVKPKTAQFRSLWVDVKAEGESILKDIGLRASRLPAILMFLPVKGQDGQVGKAQINYDGPFVAKDVAKYIDTEMMKGTGLAPIQPSAFKKLSGDIQDKEAASERADDDDDALEYSDGSTKKSSKKTSKKNDTKKKSGKKKERTLSKKEQEREDKIKEEVAAKKAAREKRVREKKEREEAEKELKKKEREEAKKNKKKGPKKKSTGKTDTTKKDSKKKNAKSNKKTTKTEKKKEPTPKKETKKTKSEEQKKTKPEEEKKTKSGEQKKTKPEEEKKTPEKGEEENSKQETTTETDEDMTPEEREEMIKKNKAQLDEILEKLKKDQAKKDREERKKQREEAQKKKDEERKADRKAKKEAREKQKKLEKEWADEDGEDIAIQEEL